MIKEIKLGKIYQSNKEYVHFPQYVILTGSSHDWKRNITKYFFFNVEEGRDGGYLTEAEVKLIFKEVE